VAPVVPLRLGSRSRQGQESVDPPGAEMGIRVVKKT
jgi:hypothetical protein